ncbi:MAG: DUF4339 domain-containing protein, partial [Thermoguttaceae bacterium]|nr:DUF4339 domain-containing protein [Thermoguttaceae bacterium]
MGYYVKKRGRVLGPFDIPQLKKLVRNRQIGRYDECSTDKVEWTRLDSLQELFSRPASDELEPQAAGAAPPDALQEADADAVWYVSNDGITGLGPYSVREVWRLMQKRKATPDSLAWVEGVPPRPLRDIPEFRGANAAGSPSEPAAPPSLPLQENASPAKDWDDVKICERCGSEMKPNATICSVCGHKEVSQGNVARLIYVILALATGVTGAHNYYAGRYGMANLQLFSFILVVLGLVCK